MERSKSRRSSIFTITSNFGNFIDHAATEFVNKVHTVEHGAQHGASKVSSRYFQVRSSLFELNIGTVFVNFG